MHVNKSSKDKTLDVETIQSDFPILSEVLHDGKRLVYLDNAATTQKPRVVLDALNAYYTKANSNVHRALHQLAQRATTGYEEVRSKVASLLHAEGGDTIVYTRGTTESINLVAHAWGRAHLSEGDEIILTEMEHHSNLVPWQLLAREKGVHLRFVPVLEDGTLDLAAYKELLGSKTKLVALVHMSNVLGTINPVAEMTRLAHEQGARVLLDAAQSVPHGPVDVQALGCDFLAFSAHKLCGPTGIGVLYIKPGLADEMNPFMGGGEMILKVKLEESTWAEPPYKFEAGTPNIAGVFGMGAAIDYLQEIGMEEVFQREQELAVYARTQLEQVQGLRLFGHAPERGGVFSFELDGVHPHDVAQFVDREGVAIRAGHHCCQPLMRKLGVTATSRASLYFYNTRKDIEQLVQALDKTREFFNHGR
jgi:cysteine desulfurase/selenocysteine lyase